MLTILDDSPWHQLPDHVRPCGTSDSAIFRPALVRRLRPARRGRPAVHDGRVPEHERRRRGLRRHPRRRPAQRARLAPAAPRAYESACGPLRVDVREPMQRIGLTVAPNDERDRAATSSGGRPTRRRRSGPTSPRSPRPGRRGLQPLRPDRRVQRLDRASMAAAAMSTRWWSCRDHSWGVRERVGIPEPVTGTRRPRSGGLFAFLFHSTDRISPATFRSPARRAGAAARHRRDRRPRDRRLPPGGAGRDRSRLLRRARPRRVRRGGIRRAASRRRQRCRSTPRHRGRRSPCRASGTAATTTGWASASGAAPRTWRPSGGTSSSPADVGHPGRSDGRPVHRIQPVRVTQRGADGRLSEGSGSLTFIAELPIEATDGRTVLRLPA